MKDSLVKLFDIGLKVIFIMCSVLFFFNWPPVMPTKNMPDIAILIVTALAFTSYFLAKPKITFFKVVMWLYTVVFFIGSFNAFRQNYVFLALIYIALGIMPAAIIFYIKKQSYNEGRRCPNCGKPGALLYSDRKELERKEGRENVARTDAVVTTFNKGTIKRTEQIAVTYIKYSHEWTCQYCKEIFTTESTERFEQSSDLIP